MNEFDKKTEVSVPFVRDAYQIVRGVKNVRGLKAIDLIWKWTVALQRAEGN